MTTLDLPSKTCSRCGERKPTSEFHKNKRTKDGLHAYCKPCNKAKAVEWQRRHPERSRAHKRNTTLKARFGITTQQYEIMFEAQDGRCAICRAPDTRTRLHVDHDHATKKVRGLLCGPCNRGMGQFKDRPERLRAAALYLETAV